MTANWRQCFGTVSLAISLLLSGTVIGGRERAIASIVPDGTLGSERSTIHPLEPNLDRIEGGALRGSNLFHSFQEFSIGEGRSAYFANPAAVENIFSRVTGSNPSRLFGTLGILGEANLFFLNPNGILFGPNFSLDVRGSFIATTANSVAFPDGSLFSASDPQAPPLLTVNVTAPIGLRFEGASPGAIVNAGNLIVNEGQNLTLAAGTVVSTGLLSAPGGEVVVVSVPGAGADGISVVELGEAGQFLGLAMEPLSASGSAPAPAEVSLPELLAGETTTGLTVNAAGEVELADSGLTVAAGDVTMQQLGADTAILSAAGNLTLVESQLGTTGDLQLLTRDTVRIRDSTAQPFIAAAGGEMLVQGDHSVDIFALNHASSGLFSGGDMILRSADTVSGDAHYWSGGSFQIEQLNGTPGDLFSPHDPIIRSQGDVRFNTYVGSSLHILAGGEVDIGSAIITETDTLANAINPTTTPELANVILSDGTPLVIDGNAKPTLDIRAGMDPAAIGDPLGTSGAVLFFNPFPFPVSPPANNPVATSANITIGEVAIAAFDGLVFLTNQYKPNLALPGGDITVTGIGIFGIGGINASGFGGTGSAVILNSRRDIHLNHSLITSAADVGDAGDIAFIANNNVLLSDGTISSSTFGTGEGGKITIDTGSLFAKNGFGIFSNTFDSGNASRIKVEARDTVSLDSQDSDGLSTTIGSIVGEDGMGHGGDIQIDAGLLSLTNGATLFAGTNGQGNAGNLIVNARRVSFDGQDHHGSPTTIASIVGESGVGHGGDIQINTRSLSVTNGAILSTQTLGQGDAGDLTIDARDTVSFDGEKNKETQSFAGTSVLADAVGNGGNIRIITENLR